MHTILVRCCRVAVTPSCAGAPAAEWLSRRATALTKRARSSVLNVNKSFTLFAPTNDAMQHAFRTGLAYALKAANVTHATDSEQATILLKYLEPGMAESFNNVSVVPHRYPVRDCCLQLQAGRGGVVPVCVCVWQREEEGLACMPLAQRAPHPHGVSAALPLAVKCGRPPALPRADVH